MSLALVPRQWHTASVSLRDPCDWGGALSALGCVLLILSKDSTIAFYGAVVSAAAITALFFGQRVAKEYAGAAVLVPYFLLTLVAIYLLGQS